MAILFSPAIDTILFPLHSADTWGDAMKSLLIPFFDDEAAQFALSHAIVMAKRFNSHIEGLLVAPNPEISSTMPE